MSKRKRMANDRNAVRADLEPATGEQWDAGQPAEEQARLGDGKELSAAVRLVVADEMFDEAFYRRESGIAGSRVELVTHYLTTGEAITSSPSAEFDVRFYRDANPDVVQSGASALAHYLEHGRAEQRYPNRRRLQRDAVLVEASGLFDARVYSWDRGCPARPGLSEVEDYLIARNYRAPIGELFDSSFYMRAYDDVLVSGPGAYCMPVLHYIAVGRAQHRVCTGHQLYREMAAGRPHFNDRYYVDQFRKRFPGQQPPADPLQHYILTGCRLDLDPAPDFSADYYMRKYPDLHASDMAAFYHFAAHGHAEGRTGRADFSSMLSRGEAAFDSGKPTILVASHEASRTGAPLVGLNIGARLANTHNVLTYLAQIIHRTARNRPRPPNTWARDFIAKNFIKQPIRIVVNDINGLALIAHFS